jgi:hypothetical protein
MPLGFRCTGCRARLHVPTRWAGTTVPCPKCGTRVVVPAGPERAEATAFERTDVERSLAALRPPTPAAAGGSFADESFTVPEADVDGRAARVRAGAITLPRRLIYAYAVAVPILMAAAFLLGCWWTAVRP